MAAEQPYIDTLTLDMSKFYKKIDKIGKSFDRTMNMFKIMPGFKKSRRPGAKLMSAILRQVFGNAKKSLALKARGYLRMQKDAIVQEVLNNASSSLKLDPSSKLYKAILMSNSGVVQEFASIKGGGDTYSVTIGIKSELDAGTKMRGTKDPNLGFWRLFEYGGASWRVSGYGTGRAGGTKEYTFVPQGQYMAKRQPGDESKPHPGVEPIRMYQMALLKVRPSFERGWKRIVDKTIKELKQRGGR